jgi:hypothetical protein
MGGKDAMRWSGGMWHKLKILITDFSFLGFSPVFVHHFFTEDFISLLVYGRFHFFIIVRNLPFLYCTEYSVVCLDCGIFISVSFIYKRETNPHVNKIIKNKNTFAFAYPVDLSTPPCSTNNKRTAEKNLPSFDGSAFHKPSIIVSHSNGFTPTQHSLSFSIVTDIASV